MSIKLADVQVRRINAAEIVVLGWNHFLAEDLKMIQAAASDYVAGALDQGLSLQEMLQDVLDKYRNFFMACGDVDSIERPSGTTVVFYLRARKGL